jgi:hypothetical protein
MLACSGPGAGAIIGRNIDIGNMNAAVAGAILLASVSAFAVTRSCWGFPTAILILFLLHPAWTVSAIHGDCGELLRDASYVVTGLVVLIMGAHMAFTVWVLVRRSRPDAARDYEEGPGGALRDGRK